MLNITCNNNIKKYSKKDMLIYMLSKYSEQINVAGKFCKPAEASGTKPCHPPSAYCLGIKL